MGVTNNMIKIVIGRLINQELHLLQKKEKEYKQLPEGYLVVRKKNNKSYYTLCDSNGEHGITQKKDIIDSLLLKKHLSSSISTHKHNIKVLNSCLSNTLDYTNDSAEIQFTKEQIMWHNSIYSQNPYKSEQLIYKCNNGIYVRSKSERIIANKLFEYGLIFKYEAPLKLNSDTLYPDFTILREDGKVVIWEHNGLMNNEDYILQTFRKIRKYRKANFIQHTNFICTEEEDIQDENTLDDIIFRFLLL